MLLLNPNRRGRGGLKILIFGGRPKWMTPNSISVLWKGIYSTFHLCLADVFQLWKIWIHGKKVKWRYLAMHCNALINDRATKLYLTSSVRTHNSFPCARANIYGSIRNGLVWESTTRGRGSRYFWRNYIVHSGQMGEGGGSKNPDFRRTSLIYGPLFVNMYLLISFKVFAFFN